MLPSPAMAWMKLVPLPAPTLLGILWAAAKLSRPARYLEIGSRQGHSLAMVHDAAPACRLTAVDFWPAEYAGEPDSYAFFHGNLARLGAEAVCHQGNSHDLLPTLAGPHDLILVDGDHSQEGAAADLRDAARLLAPGGILLFDDLDHPAHPYLRQVWRDAYWPYPAFVWESPPAPRCFGVALLCRPA